MEPKPIMWTCTRGVFEQAMCGHRNPMGRTKCAACGATRRSQTTAAPRPGRKRQPWGQVTLRYPGD